MSPAKIAQLLQVVREGTAPVRLYIDGVLFPYATVDGFSVHPHRGKMPGVTVTIAGWRVEVIDDLDAKPGTLTPGSPAPGSPAPGSPAPGSEQQGDDTGD